MPRSLALALLAAPAVLAAAPAPAPEIAQVQQHLRAVDTMTADFAQTDRNGRTLTGTLTVKRPGRIRFQYQPGVPLLVVGDGKALTMIDYQVGQVSRYPIGDTPLAILLDPNKDLTGIAHVVPSGDPKMLLIEGSDPKHRAYGTITVAFGRDPSAPAGLMPLGWTVVDGQNNRTTVRLSHQRFDVPVSDNAFRFNDPRHKGPRH